MRSYIISMEQAVITYFCIFYSQRWAVRNHIGSNRGEWRLKEPNPVCVFCAQKQLEPMKLVTCFNCNQSALHLCICKSAAVLTLCRLHPREHISTFTWGVSSCLTWKEGESFQRFELSRKVKWAPLTDVQHRSSWLYFFTHKVPPLKSLQSSDRN